MEVTIHKHFNFLKCCFTSQGNKHMSLRTLHSSNGWLSSKSVLSHQPYILAVEALVQFNSLERGVQRHWEQRGEMGATSCEGPHACLLQNYSSQQIKYEPVQPPRSQASLLCDSPSQTDITWMGGGGRS